MPADRSRPRSDRPRSASPFGSRLLGRAGESPARLRVRIQILLTGGVVVSNIVGAAVVSGLTSLIPGPAGGLGHRIVLADVVAIPIYVAVAVTIGVVVGTRRALQRLRWVGEGTTPDATDQRAALRVPMLLAYVQGWLWAAAVVFFTILNGILQPGAALTVGITVALGGTVVVGVGYLLSEFSLRPVAALALAANPPDSLVVPGVRARAVLAWALGTAVPAAGIAAVAGTALVDSHVNRLALAASVLGLAVTVLLVGLLFTWMAARATVDPIQSVRRAMADVEGGDLSSEVPVYDGTEMGLLQAGFNRMVAAVRERQRIRDEFSRQVGEDVARASLEQEVRLGGEVRNAAVLFVDIIGSTRLAVERPAPEVVAVLNTFFGVVVDVVTTEMGSVNKFEGDAALAIFGAPQALPDSPTRALRAARQLARRLAHEVTDAGAAVGVAAGDLVAGHVGAEQRYEYTVIGDPVNEAARLTELAKQQPSRVLASGDVVASAREDERAHWHPLGEVVLRGRDRPTALFGLGD